MKLTAPIISYLLLLLLLLGSLSIHAQRDTLILGYGMDQRAKDGSNTDSTIVQFSLELKYLNVSSDIDTTQYPHYNIITFYGDGTFEKNIIIDTVKEVSRIELKPNPTNPTSIVYYFEHIYKRKPTQTVYVSVAKSKTTDGVPPPRISSPDFPTWMDSVSVGNTGSLSSTEVEIATALNRLTRTAAEKQFILPDTNAAQISQNIQLDFHLGPVPENDYVGIVDLKGISSSVKEGAIFIHYNLASFADSITLDTYKIRSWQDEQIEIHNFNEFYDLTGTNPRDFENVITIGFSDLDSSELRRYVFPFECPKTLEGHFDEPVFFHAVVIDSSLIDGYVQGVQNLDGDIITITEVEDRDKSGRSAGFLGKKGSGITMSESPQTIYFAGGLASVEEPAAAHRTPFTIPVQESNQLVEEVQDPIPDLNLPNPILTYSYLAEINSDYTDLLNNLGGNIIGEDEYIDFVRESHDPNSILINPECFGFSPKKLSLLVNVQNYGLGGARNIVITLAYDPQLTKDTFIIHSHSFGRDALIETAYFNTGSQKVCLIAISNIYLPGLLEIANERGDIDLGTLDPNDPKPLNFAENEYGAISQGNLVLLTTTKNILSGAKEFIVNGQVTFDDQDPIPMADTTLFSPATCGGIGPFFRGGIRFGYNYFFPFDQFDPNFNPVDNFTIGAFFDFSPFPNTRLFYRLEGNYNKWGYQSGDLILRQTNIELAFMARYLISRRWSVGIGPSLLTDVDWAFDKEGEALPFTFDTPQVGGLLDAAYYFGPDRRWSAGLRGHYYPNSVNVNGTDTNISGLQAYIAFTLF